MKKGLNRLDIGLQKLADPFAFIEHCAKGKSVLNVGPAGGIDGYLPNNKDAWLHERIRCHASELVGVDIDAKAIEYAASYNYEILNENCEKMALGKEFDLIVMSDVIEHVNAPVTAINNLLSHLTEDGKLIITTPNATAGNILIRSLLHCEINVLADHVTTYYPEHFKAICDRLHCTLDAVYMFDHKDKRTWSFRCKSALFQILTLISPRLASSMLVVIQKKNNA